MTSLHMSELLSRGKLTTDKQTNITPVGRAYNEYQLSLNLRLFSQTNEIFCNCHYLGKMLNRLMAAWVIADTA